MFFFFMQPDGSPPPQLYLREHRNRAGLTLKELAERLEVHYTAVQKWETGISSPTIPHVLGLATIYGIHPGALFLDPSGSTVKKRYDTLTTLAAMMSVSPAALLLAGEEPERRHRAEQLTRCLNILDQCSEDWAEHWLRVGELSQSVNEK